MDDKHDNWVEDINAFAEVFGAGIDRIVLRDAVTQQTGKSDHPLFQEVKSLVSDDEVGIIACNNAGLKPLQLPPGAAIPGLFKLSFPPANGSNRRTEKTRIKDYPALCNIRKGCVAYPAQVFGS